MPRVPPRTGSIKKGEKRNPKGSSAKARALSKVRRMSAADLADLTSLILTGDLDKLKEIGTDPQASIMNRLTAKLLLDCYTKGDVSIYRAILDRVVGRPKESQSIEISTPVGGALHFAHLSEEELDKQLAALKAREDETKK
jgi:predicted transcriptional regulator